MHTPRRERSFGGQKGQSSENVSKTATKGQLRGAAPNARVSNVPLPSTYPFGYRLNDERRKRLSPPILHIASLAVQGAHLVYLRVSVFSCLYPFHEQLLHHFRGLHKH